MGRYIRRIRRYINKYDLKRMDLKLLIPIVVLSIISFICISKTSTSLAYRQVFGIVLGVIALAIMALMDYHIIQKFQWVLYIGIIAFLLLVLIAGINVNNAKRWFSLGFLGTFQPSEIAKIFMIVIMSKFLSDHRDNVSKLRYILIYFGLVMIPVFLIYREPDLSTCIVYVFVAAVIIFIGGLSRKIVIGFFATVIPVGAFLLWYIQQPWQILFSEHQVNRVITFFNPSAYITSTYAQQYNSVLSIGSGGLLGKAITGSSTVVKGSSYLAESQNDFIFAVVGEEFGFIGCLIVIAMMIFMVIECLIIARDAKDLSGRLIAAGVAAMIGIQSFVNIGVATSVLPNTGLSLPFVSYGLSALITDFIAIGIVLNISLQRIRR